MNTNTATAPVLSPVHFYEDTIFSVDYEGQPYTPVRPIIENLGVDWANQFVKLKNENKRWNCCDITTVGRDGKNRDMLCLPVRKISGFLNTINANKVKPELRDKLIRYQNECDEVLWSYWTTGRAVSQAVPQAVLDELATWRRQAEELDYTVLQLTKTIDKMEVQLTKSVDQLEKGILLVDNKIDQFRINSNRVGPVWSFSHIYCVTGTKHYVMKDELYDLFVEHCNASRVQPCHRNHFFRSLYAAVTTTYASTATIAGKKFPVVRNLGIKPGADKMLALAKEECQQKIQDEIESRQRFYGSLGSKGGK